MNNKLHGLGVAMITPFNETGLIDYTATERLISYLLEGAVDFLVVLGTTGETPTLSADEQREYVRYVVRTVNGRVPIVLGKSSNDTMRLVQELQALDCEGIDYILSAVPSYNKPNQEGIYQHYAAIAAVAPRPIILYNVPGRTGVNMLASTTLRLAENFKNIVGIKEASGNLDQASAILASRSPEFLVFSGDDSLTLPMVAMGADGVISVIGNALPKLFHNMLEALTEGNLAAAATIHLRLHNLYNYLFAEGNPVGIKAAVNMLGIVANRLRLPLVPATAELVERIKKELKYLGVI